MERGQSIPVPINPQGLQRRGASIPLRAYTANDDNNYFLKPEEALYLQNNGNMLFRLNKEATDTATVGSNLIYDSMDKTKNQVTSELNAQVLGIQQGIMTAFKKEESPADNPLAFELQQNAEKIKANMLAPQYILSNMIKEGTLGVVDPTVLIDEKDKEAVKMIHGMDDLQTVTGFAAGLMGFNKGIGTLKDIGLLPRRIRGFSDALVDTLGYASLTAAGLYAQKLYGNLDDEQYAETMTSSAFWDISMGALMGTFAHLHRKISPFSWLGRNFSRLALGSSTAIGGGIGYLSGDEGDKLDSTILGLGLGAGAGALGAYAGGALTRAKIQNARNREIALRDAEHIMNKFDLNSNDVKVLSSQLELMGVVKDARTAEDEIKLYFKSTFDQLTENLLKQNKGKRIDDFTKNDYIQASISEINKISKFKEDMMDTLEKFYGKGIDPERWSDRSIQIVAQFKQDFANQFQKSEILPITQTDKVINSFENFVDKIINDAPRTYTLRFDKANIQAIENSFYKTMKAAYKKAGFDDSKYLEDFKTVTPSPYRKEHKTRRILSPEETQRDLPSDELEHFVGDRRGSLYLETKTGPDPTPRSPLTSGVGKTRVTRTTAEQEMDVTRFHVQHMLDKLKEEAKKHPFMHEGQLDDRLRVIAAETLDKMHKGPKAARGIRNYLKQEYMVATEDLIDHVKKYSAARRKKLVDRRNPNLGDKDALSLKHMYQARRELGFMIDNGVDYNGNKFATGSQVDRGYRFAFKMISEKIERLAAEFYGKNGKQVVSLIHTANKQIQEQDLFTKIAVRSKFNVEQKTLNIIDNAYSRYHMGRAVGGPIAGEIAMAIGQLEKPTTTFSGKDTMGFSVWQRFKNSMKGLEPYISYQLPSAQSKKFVGGYDPLYFNDSPRFLEVGSAMLNRRVKTFEDISQFFSSRKGVRTTSVLGTAWSYGSREEQHFITPERGMYQRKEREENE